jgi:hypothetical protein
MRGATCSRRNASGSTEFSGFGIDQVSWRSRESSSGVVTGAEQAKWRQTYAVGLPPTAGRSFAGASGAGSPGAAATSVRCGRYVRATASHIGAGAVGRDHDDLGRSLGVQLERL